MLLLKHFSPLCMQRTRDKAGYFKNKSQSSLGNELVALCSSKIPIFYSTIIRQQYSDCKI